MKKAWSFGLPPSVGDTLIRTQLVSRALAPLGCRVVRQSQTYGALLRDLLDGRVDIAWAPPVVCARVEDGGGRMLVRCNRRGTTAYRGVLYARRSRQLTMRLLRGLRAAWPDAQSMAGYILPRALMRESDIKPDQHFSRQDFMGTYAACVQAVLDGRADVSSCYASASFAAAPVDGFVTLAGARAEELAAIQHSRDCPNDGIITSPRLPPRDHDGFAAVFKDLLAEPVQARSLAQALDVDNFDVPPGGTYARLLEYLAGPTRELGDLLA